MANRWIFLLFFSFLPEFRMHFKQHSVCIQKGGGGGVEKGQGLKGVIPNELLYLDLHKTQNKTTATTTTAKLEQEKEREREREQREQLLAWLMKLLVLALLLTNTAQCCFLGFSNIFFFFRGGKCHFPPAFLLDCRPRSPLRRLCNKS